MMDLKHKQLQPNTQLKVLRTMTESGKPNKNNYELSFFDLCSEVFLSHFQLIKPNITLGW